MTTLRAKTRREFSEGPPDVHESVHEWVGWTAADAFRHRLARFRAAGAEVVATDGHSIIVRHRRDGWTETETLTFEDAPGAGQ